jgi:hypothetical protein
MLWNTNTDELTDVRKNRDAENKESANRTDHVRVSVRPARVQEPILCAGTELSPLVPHQHGPLCAAGSL